MYQITFNHPIQNSPLHQSRPSPSQAALQYFWNAKTDQFTVDCHWVFGTDDKMLLVFFGSQMSNMNAFRFYWTHLISWAPSSPPSASFFTPSLSCDMKSNGDFLSLWGFALSSNLVHIPQHGDPTKNWGNSAWQNLSCALMEPKSHQSQMWWNHDLNLSH